MLKNSLVNIKTCFKSFERLFWTVFIFDNVRCHIGWRGKRNIFIRVCKPLPSRCVLKLRLVTIRDELKMTISVSGGWQLQMISELDTGPCVNEDIGPSKGWIVRSYISWRGKRNIFLYGCGNFSLINTFKTVRLTTIRNWLKRTISVSSGFGLLQMV